MSRSYVTNWHLVTCFCFSNKRIRARKLDHFEQTQNVCATSMTRLVPHAHAYPRVALFAPFTPWPPLFLWVASTCTHTFFALAKLAKKLSFCSEGKEVLHRAPVHSDTSQAFWGLPVISLSMPAPSLLYQNLHQNHRGLITTDLVSAAAMRRGQRAVAKHRGSRKRRSLTTRNCQRACASVLLIFFSGSSHIYYSRLVSAGGRVYYTYWVTTYREWLTTELGQRLLSSLL